MTRSERQKMVAAWVRSTFGDNAMHRRERAMRFLEEALEVVQAAGITAAEIRRVQHAVYFRPPGDIKQEFGGVSLCLLALCEAEGVNADACELQEIMRVSSIDPNKFRSRHNEKVKLGISMPRVE